MDRRKFFKKTSSGVLAAAFLPLLSFDKKKLVSADVYFAAKKLEKNGKAWDIIFKLNSNLLTKAKEMDKDMRVVFFEFSDSKSPDSKKILTTYKVEDVTEKTIDGMNLHFFTLKVSKSNMNKEEMDIAKELFGKEIVVEIHNNCHAIARDMKKNTLMNFKYDVLSEDDSSCFLTTACVFHKGLADDCKELTTLRNLRANKMNPNPKFQKLIAEYEIVAPKMLLNINQAENKNEILDTIYARLVLPSVALVEEGKDEEAIEYYADFVNKMKVLYL